MLIWIRHSGVLAYDGGVNKNADDVFFTILLIAVLTVFCALLAFIAPGLSTTLMTEKAREAAQIPDPDKRQKIKGYALYVLAGFTFVGVMLWTGIDGVHSQMT